MLAMRIVIVLIYLVHIVRMVSSANNVNRCGQKCCYGYHEKNGICVVCPPGFYGRGCLKPCSRIYYGSNCKYFCGCASGYLCNPVNGTCYQEFKYEYLRKEIRTVLSTAEGKLKSHESMYGTIESSSTVKNINPKFQRTDGMDTKENPYYYMYLTPVIVILIIICIISWVLYLKKYKKRKETSNSLESKINTTNDTDGQCVKKCTKSSETKEHCPKSLYVRNSRPLCQQEEEHQHRELNKTSSYRGKYQELDKTSSYRGKYQELNKTSSYQGKYQELDKTSSYQGNYQSLGFARDVSHEYDDLRNTINMRMENDASLTVSDEENEYQKLSRSDEQYSGYTSLELKRNWQEELV